MGHAKGSSRGSAVANRYLYRSSPRSSRYSAIESCAACRMAWASSTKPMWYRSHRGPVRPGSRIPRRRTGTRRRRRRLGPRSPGSTAEASCAGRRARRWSGGTARGRAGRGVAAQRALCRRNSVSSSAWRSSRPSTSRYRTGCSRASFRGRRWTCSRKLALRPRRKPSQPPAPNRSTGLPSKERTGPPSTVLQCSSAGTRSASKRSQRDASSTPPQRPGHQRPVGGCADGPKLIPNAVPEKPQDAQVTDTVDTALTPPRSSGRPRGPCRAAVFIRRGGPPGPWSLIRVTPL